LTTREDYTDRLLVAQTQLYRLLGLSCMTENPSKARRSIGRPPAGARAGEKAKDYPQLSIRLPEDARKKLQAMSQITERPQWRVISDAIECYFRERPEAERRMIEDLMRSRVRTLPARRPRT
jgi:predicted DNA-binding protein